MSHLTKVIEEEILRIIGTNDSPEDAWHTSLYEQKRADLTQAMTKSALAVIEEIRAAFKDQSEIGVNHLNVELDYLKEQLER